MGGCPLDDALRWIADVEPDEFMDYLQNVTKQLGEEEITDVLSSLQREIEPESTEVAESSAVIGVVGSASTDLESIKEFIKADHEYGKPSEDSDVIVVPQTAESVAEIVLEEEETELVEVAAAPETQLEPPHICISEEPMEVTLSPSPSEDYFSDDYITRSLYPSHDDKFIKDTLSPRSSSASDSDYESSASVYSPLGEEQLWEESFQELFPALL